MTTACAWGCGIGQYRRRRIPISWLSTALRRQSVYFGPVAFIQKRPRLTLGFEIAQAPAWQANHLNIPTNIEFAVRSTVDSETFGTLVAHFDFPH